MPGALGRLARTPRGPGGCLLALAGCAPHPEPARVLELLQATPEAGATGVFLNERVQLYFSERIDPSSVHARSARVLLSGDSTSRDAAARGTWQVAGERLTFTPAPVLAHDLSDGGWRPGERHRVELVGFPRPEGLRSESGAPLLRSVRWEFEVVAVDAARRGFVFEDSSLEVGSPLLPRATVVASREPILLEGDEPLDPSTLFGEDFVLRSVPAGDPRERRGIPVQARLVENSLEDAKGERRGALVELLPEEPLEAETRYRLYMRPGSGLRDFGGHPVLLLWPSGVVPYEIEVRAASAAARDAYFEEFFGTENRSLEAVPGADGSAWWGASGRVEVRYPAAAGDGRDGVAALSGVDPRGEFRTRALSVPAGQELRLSADPGLVVLRAQGSLQVEGRLTRAAGDSALDFQKSEWLSAWLERVAGQARTATVLVAGGDLVVRGSISVDGPLLLAAGGRIRVGSRNYIRASKLYYLGEGGRVDYLNLPTDRILQATQADLVLDPPLFNALAEPLVFAVRSSSIPHHGRAARWHVPDWKGEEGSGSIRVRYVGERDVTGPGAGSEVIVADPALLRDCPSLRLQIELVIWPASTLIVRGWWAGMDFDDALRWDPPWVDYVELAWDPAGPESRR